MLINQHMDLGELAQRMGQEATHEDAEYMRDVLCERHTDRDTAEIDDREWKHLLITAFALQLADELEEDTGMSIDEIAATLRNGDDDLVRLVDISLCPTDLEYPNGDIYDADKLTAAIAKFVAARHPVAEISVKIGHRQGESWAYVDGDADLGADLVAAFFDQHGSDEALFREVEPDLLDYEIAGYRCRMEPHHALAWNAGHLSRDAIEGAQILVDDTWTCLWSAIDTDGIDTPLYDDLNGMPANRIE